MIPVQGNPEFHPGSSLTFLHNVWPHKDMQVFHFFDPGVFRDRTAIPLLPDVGSLHFWTYFQIGH